MKRGYAVSGMLYTILVLFMALLLSFLYSMQNKKNILDKLKTEVVEAFYCSKADNIEDLRGSTVVATNVTQEDDNVLVQLPKEGRYDTTSYLSVPMSEISSSLINEYTGLFRLATVSSGTYQAYDSFVDVNVKNYNSMTLNITSLYNVSNIRLTGFKVDGTSVSLGTITSSETLDVTEYDTIRLQQTPSDLASASATGSYVISY